jgi:DNA-directed RNA polymerase subunit RPC12/RpoP
MYTEKQESPETMCSRCGAQANWRFIDADEKTVEIVCPDCGRFEIPKAELERAEFEMVEPEERRT